MCYAPVLMEKRGIKLVIIICICFICRANDERVGDINRALNFDQKARDLTSQNGKYINILNQHDLPVR